MRITLMILAGILLLNGLSFGQISQGGKPLEFLALKSTEIPVVEMPLVNNVRLLKQATEELESENKLKTFRFANPFKVNLSAQNSGVWTNTEDGTHVWRLQIRSKGAESINLIFDKFRLPEGARLFLFNEKENHLLGAFTSFNNKATEKFAVMPVSGDELTVQYELPSEYQPQENFVITQVNHDFAGILKDNERRPFYPTIAGLCNVDINCDLGEEWEEVKDAVCRIFVNGKELCTGTLINNTAEDQKPYIISAAHCYDEWEFAETSIYAFNYESPYCAPLDGDPSHSISGALMKAQFDSLDFALTELSLVPPPEFRPYYAGWDKSGTLNDTVVSIHHPWGDIKKITFDYDQPEIDDYNSHYVKNGFLKVIRWEEGVTESGSSGGALFNREKNVIGTLTGGLATCVNPVRDYFERLDLAWDYHQDISKQLKHWLDPINAGTQSLSGKRFYSGEELCMAFTNLNDEDEHQIISLTVSDEFSGYWGGTNNAGIAEIVEKFSIDGNEQLSGISMGVGKLVDTGNNSELEIKVYNGSNYPETLIYSENFDLDFLAEDAMNFFGFSEMVEPGETFFIGFDLKNVHSADTFAVYQSIREPGEENYFYYKKGNLWYSFENTNVDNYSITNIFELVACNVSDTASSIDTNLVKSPLEIIVYPNPTHSVFTMEAGIDISTEDITVFNLLGKEVQVVFDTPQKRKIKIDLSGNLPGVYFVRFNNGKELVSQKISFVPW